MEGKGEALYFAAFRARYSRPKGPLLDFLILDVAGTKEFDKMRLGLAMVDSLQEFESRMRSSSCQLT